MLAAALLVLLGCPGGDPDGPLGDRDGDGYSAADDCDDLDPEVHPGADERCNEVDDDCDGETDEEPVDALPWYADGDGDGHGAGEPEASCQAPPGRVGTGGDCDDGDAGVHPGADEHCDHVDEDCDGEVDEDPVDPSTYYPDDDGDGYGRTEEATQACWIPYGHALVGGDCDDADPARSPGLEEICEFSRDEDCDGEVDEGCPDCTVRVPLDHATVQGALDVAGPDEVICLDPGTYAEALDFGGSSAWVTGLRDPEETVLDGPGTEPVVTMALGEAGARLSGVEVTRLHAGDPCVVLYGVEARLDDLRITGCYGGALDVVGAIAALEDVVVERCYRESYGVVYLSGESEVRAEGLVLRENIGVHHAGGLFLSGSDLVAANLVVEGNQGEKRAGGIYGISSHLELSQAEFSGNWTPDGSGGGLRLEDCTAALEGVTFTENVAAQDGGGMYAQAGGLDAIGVHFLDNNAHSGGGIFLDGVVADIEQATFRDNQTDLVGGALYVTGTGSLDLAWALVAENTAGTASTTSAATGGGLCVGLGAEVVLASSIFVGNSVDAATGHGGGVTVGPGGRLAAYHVALVGNEAEHGGGILVGYAAQAFLQDSIVASSVGGTGVEAVGADPRVVVDHCDVWDNDLGDYEGLADPTGESGNLSVDPQFLDTTSSSPWEWDLHLDATSPLVDAGSSERLDPDGSPADQGAWGGTGAAGWDLDADGYPSWWQPGGWDPAYAADGLDCDDLDAALTPLSGC